MRTLRGVFVLLMTTSIAFAGGDWKDSPLHDWFAGLASRKGLCCSSADGVTITDAQWDMKDGHYRVFIYNQWIPIPDDAVVVEKNIYGQAVVWPYTRRTENEVGRIEVTIYVRCFLPGVQA
jgi:hypothetical protein